MGIGDSIYGVLLVTLVATKLQSSAHSTRKIQMRLKASTDVYPAVTSDVSHRHSA